MNNFQFRRYQKIFFEEFFLLKWENNKNEILLIISGSSYNIYNVIINKITKKIDCSCKDFLDNCSENNSICKHCCFILFIVLKLFNKFNPKIGIIKLNRPNGYNIINESNFFNDYILTNVEILLLQKKFNKLEQKNNSFINIQLINKYNYLTLIMEQKKLLYQQFIEKKLVQSEQSKEECGICFNNITINDLYLCCPDCNIFVHKKCMLIWLEKKEDCIYCRSKIWENFYELELNKQLNLLKINI
jgi:hypothetical protein